MILMIQDQAQIMFEKDKANYLIIKKIFNNKVMI